MKLTVATCQFAVGADVRANARQIERGMRAARLAGADVAHFCEGALSGYAGVDFPSHDGFEWGALDESARGIAELAGRLGLWVLFGSSHRLSGAHKPHNSVYVVNPRGQLVERYDKRFCAGPSATTGELAHYTPGDHSSVLRIRGIRCGILICHEYRYPELYRDYVRQGVRVLFHSYHAGNLSPARLRVLRDEVGVRHSRLNRGSTLPEITMPAASQGASASNHIWISASNTSARESLWPSFFVRPDGVITRRLARHRTGVLISTVDTTEKLYDSTRAWRRRAMDGVLHSGSLVRDRRSSRRKEW